MQTLHDPAEFQRRTLDWSRAGIPIAFVPTMGALHAGHLHLMTEARRLAGPAGKVAVSIFVNPTQFNSADDLARYPRTLETDAAGCRDAGVDLIFAPSPQDMYPSGHATSVEVAGLTEPLCGAHRPGHFRGVTTVVMKLLSLAQPTWALFGWKDAQQFIVLRRMARDLHLPVEMIGIETVREPDGLAMSSRNAYLNGAERAIAPVLYRALSAARTEAKAGQRSSELLIRAARDVIAREPAVSIEYLELRDVETLETLAEAVPGRCLLAIAAHLGPARLIDNVRF